MQLNNLTYYIERYLDGSISNEEWQILKELLARQEHITSLECLMDEQLLAGDASGQDFPVVVNRMKAGLMAKIGNNSVAISPVIPAKNKNRYWVKRYWAAAAIIFIFTLGAYLWRYDKKMADLRALSVNTATIAPAKEGAILTLANGKEVSLDTIENGVITLPQGAVVRVVNGVIRYEGGAGATSAYNTLSIPKGRQFNFFLPDGTRVWLNSASAISFPVAFSGGERSVSVRGEAFFQVAKNSNMPFHVNVKGKAAIKVLGTSFNINAYDDEEQVLTTLIEGAVQVSSFDSLTRNVHAVNLKPGQQAQINQVHSNIVQVKTMNASEIDKLTAWKNGIFNFEGASLEDVMRQVGRWYDLEIVFEKEIPALRFGGSIPRNLMLNDLLDILEKSEVKFRLEQGRRLIVTR